MNWLQTQMTMLDAATGAIGFGVNWVLQSTLLLAVGLLVGRLLKQCGSAVQSVVFRTTLVAVLVCPIATWLLSAAGVSGWSVEMPEAWTYQQAKTVVADTDPLVTEPAVAPPVFDSATRTEPPIAPNELLFAEAPLPSATPPASIAPTDHGEVLTAAIEPTEPAVTTPVEADIFTVSRFAVAAAGGAVLWIMISAGLLWRLATAWRRLARLRRQAAQAEPTILRTCDELASQLAVPAPDVRRSPFLPSPCLAGLRRPAVLLPDAALSMSVRDVLIHELAHLARRDCHWNLLRRLATAVFFFQPLLWKLSRYLEQTAEEVCDDFVVHFGGDRTAYAHRLVDIAELSSAPVAAAGVGIVSLRSMLAKRVTRIMDTSRSLSTRVGSLLLTFVLIGGLAGTTVVGFVGLRPRPSQAEPESFADESDSASDSPTGRFSPAAIAEGETTEGSGTGDRHDNPLIYAGKVVDPNGKPVDGAKIHFVYWYSHQETPPDTQPVATTGPNGRFQFEMARSDFRQTGDSVPPWLWGTLVAVAEGHGVAWAGSVAFETSGAALKELETRAAQQGRSVEKIRERIDFERGPLQLAPDDIRIDGRVVDIEGQPIAGANVKVVDLRTGKDDSLDEWEQVSRRPGISLSHANRAAPRHLYGPFVTAILPTTQTDQEGRFTLNGLGRDRLVQLVIERPGHETSEVLCRLRSAEPVTVTESLTESPMQVHGPAFTHVAGPARSVEGVVRNSKTSAPVAGVIVRSVRGALDTGDGQDYRVGSDLVRAVTDHEGRYLLSGLPKADHNPLIFRRSGDPPYLTTTTDVDTRGSDNSPVQLDVKLVPAGGTVVGRVVDKDSGEGVSGRIKYLAINKSDLPRQASPTGQRRDIRSDIEGRFQFAVPPGTGYVAFTAFDDTYLKKADRPKGASDMTRFLLVPVSSDGPEFHALAKIDVGASGDKYPVHLRVERGPVIRGRILDPDGRPLSGGLYIGRNDHPHPHWWPVDGGKFHVLSFDGSRPRQLVFVHPERKLAGEIALKEKPDAELTVRLQPWGTVTGRIVDREGVAIDNLKIVAGSAQNVLAMIVPQPGKAMVLRPPGFPLPPTMDGRSQIKTDREGRFVIAGLLPRVKYDLSGRRHSVPIENLTGDIVSGLTLSPGETRDLGVIELKAVHLLEVFKMRQETIKRQQDGAKNESRESGRTKRKRVAVIRGRVTSANSQPAAGARVAAIGMKIQASRGGDLGPRGEVLAEGTTDGNGQYTLTLESVSSKSHRYANVIARKDGSAIVWQKLNLDANDTEVSLKLRPEEPIRGRLVDIEGQPAAGARLVIQGLMKRSIIGLPSSGVGFRGGEFIPAAWLQPFSSDDEGRFTIRGIPAGHGVLLKVEGNERVAPQDVALNTGMPEQRGERDATYRSLVKNVKADEEAVVPLSPAQLFEGVVTYEDTGEPAPHARLTIWASQQAEIGSMISVPGKADANGRYRISPMPGVRFGVTAYPPDGVAYLARQTPSSAAIRWKTGDRVRQVDMALPRGVLVRGKVMESETDAPVAGASIQYVPEEANNPHTADDILTGWQGIQLSDEQGEFEIAVLPGPGRLLVHGPQGKYVLQEIAGRLLSRGETGGRRNYVHAVHEIDPEEGADPINVELRLQPGRTMAGLIVDEQGDPAKEVLVISRLSISPLSLSWRGHTPPTLGGSFELSGLDAKSDYPIYFLDAKRRLGATAMIRAAGAEPTVVLKPCGNATARYVDPDGNPHVGFQPGLDMVVTPGAHPSDWEAAKRGEIAADADFVSNIDRTNYWTGPKTDDEGRIRFPALIPGATYRITTFEDGKPKILKEFQVQSNETLDLGDVVINVDN